MTRRAYHQFCPTARSLDIMGERWTMLIMRELFSGPKRYSDLRRVLTGMGSNLLADRLRSLQDAGVIRSRELPAPAGSTVYEPTARGWEFESVLLQMARWGLSFLDMPTEEEPLHDHHIAPAIKAMVKIEALTQRPLRAWLRLDEGDFTLEVQKAKAPDGNLRPLHARLATRPGAPDDPDVTLTSSLPMLLWLRRGEVDWADAGATVEGSAAAQKYLSSMLGLRLAAA